MPIATLLRRGLPYVPPCLLAIAGGAVSMYTAHGSTVPNCPAKLVDARADAAGHHVPVEEVQIAGGAVSYVYGDNCGPDRGPHGEGSAIFAGPGGVHTVRGCIYRHYRMAPPDGDGGPEGVLGWPTSDELVIPGGWVTYFQGAVCPGAPRGEAGSGGAIYASLATGAHSVQGCIYAAYRDRGGPHGALGYPTTDEVTVPGGSASYFKGTLCGPETGPGGSGSAIFASAGGREVHAIEGCVFALHLRRGGAAGPLGLPISDEIAIPGGTVTYFAGGACGGRPGPQGEGGAIYAGPGGVHDVAGCIYEHYRTLGGPGSALGFPVSDELTIAGRRIVRFQYGHIVADDGSVNVVYD